MMYTCNHIGLFSFQPEELTAFYVDKLGFERGESRFLSKDLMSLIFTVPANGRMTKLFLGEISLEVFSLEGGDLKSRTVDTSGYNHWGLTVEDKEIFCAKAEERGAEVIKVADKDRFIYFIKDPEGNLIEVFEK